MPYIVELIGGPLDGRQRPIKSRPPQFLWVKADSDSTRALLTFYRQPDPKMAFYRQEQERKVGDGTHLLTFLYAQYSHVPCTGCGAMHVRTGGKCTFCGETL